jgi:hypothetical protein
MMENQMTVKCAPMPDTVAPRRLPLVSQLQLNSLAGQGFGGIAVRAASGFVGTDKQAVVGTIGSWHGTASQGSYVPATTPAAGQAALKRTRNVGLAMAAKDADRGIEGIARQGSPV